MLVRRAMMLSVAAVGMLAAAGVAVAQSSGDALEGAHANTE
jgi:hypothetical protein